MIGNRRGRMAAVLTAICCALSYLAFAKTVTVPYDAYLITARTLTVSGRVVVNGTAPSTIRIDVTGGATKTATVAPGGRFEFDFNHVGQAIQYSVEAIKPTDGPSTICDFAPGSAAKQTFILGPSQDVTLPDFQLTCGPNTPPTISLVTSPNPVVFPGGPSPVISVQSLDPQGRPVTVTMYDARTNAPLATVQSGAGSMYQFQYAHPGADGVYRLRFVASDGFIQSESTYVTVVALSRPSATAVMPPVARSTATVGAIPATFGVADSGAATYSIPIAVPPGPAGMQPSLGISYNSQSGQSAVGMGWSLSGVSAISRCPASIASNGARAGINYDNSPANDHYCLDGQRLMPVSDRVETGLRSCGSSGSRTTYRREYRTEIETYSRIFAYEDYVCDDGVLGPSRFEVETKAGHWLLFGIANHLNPDGSPITPENPTDPSDDGVGRGYFGDMYNGTWVLSWPSSVGQPFWNSVKTWPLVRAIDKAGNFIQYEYCGKNLGPLPGRSCNERPPMAAFNTQPVGAFPETEYHLKAIHYGGRANRTTRVTEVSPFLHVELLYGDRASDQHRFFDSGGGETNLSKYLRAITTVVGGAAAHTYFLQQEFAPVTGRMRLANMQHCVGGVGESGFSSTGTCLVPTTFSYQNGAVGDFLGGLSATGNKEDLNAVADVDGDGQSDLVFARDEASFVQVALSSARVNGVYSFANRHLPQGVTVTRSSDKFLADFNGDGRPDLIIKGVGGGTFIACDLQLLSPSSQAQTPSSACKTLSFATPNNNFYLQGDFNGDGRIDLLLYQDNQSFHLHLGDPIAGFGPAIAVTNIPSASNVHEQIAAGDFNGDGRTDILFRKAAVECQLNMSPLEADQTAPTEPCVPEDAKWRICFSDPESNTSLFNCLGEVAGGNGLLKNIVTMDFNGDGLADLAYPAFPTNPPAGKETWWNICLSAGDGSFQKAGTKVVQTGNGVLYDPKSLCKSIPIMEGPADKVVFGDFDGDGRTDMARSTVGTTWRVCLSRTNRISDHANNLRFDCSDRTAFDPGTGDLVNNVFVGDFNGDGKSDLFRYRAESFDIKLAPTGFPDLLTGVSNGLGATIGIDHAPLTDSSVYSRSTTAAAGANEVLIQTPLYVVKQTRESNGVGGDFSHTYTYQDLKGGTDGRGLLGFGKREVVDSNLLKRVTVYHNDNGELTWWRAGRPQRIQLISSTGQVLSETKNDWQLKGKTYPKFGKDTVFPVHLVRSIEAKRDLDGSSLQCTRVTLYDPKVSEVPQVLDDGQPTMTVTETGSACDITNSNWTFESGGYRKITTNAYYSDETSWTLGRLARSSVQHVAPLPDGTGSQSITRTSAFSYQGLNAGSCAGAPMGHLCSEIIEPDESVSSPLRHDTSYEYDAWGNTVKTTRSFQRDGPIALVSSASFAGTNGRFPDRVINAKDHVEDRAYSNGGEVFGVATVVTKYLASISSEPGRYLVTAKYLDGFGRVVGERVEANDGSRLAETDVEWKPDSYVGSTALYSVTTTSHAGPQTKVFYDSLQREVVRQVKIFNGGMVDLKTTYDSKGRKATQEKPAGNGFVRTIWGYDELDRVTSECTSENGSECPGGVGLQTLATTTYRGYHTVSIRTNGVDPSQKSIARRNSQGQVDQTTDCLGDSTVDTLAVCGVRQALVTNFRFDATGNVVYVQTPPTKNGQVTRTTVFDRRGRKSSSVDPDLGDSTFTYSGANELLSHSYKQDGVAVTTIAMGYDKLGRMTTRSIANASSEFWDYDSCPAGRDTNGALCSSSATEGGTFTSRRYEHDEYGRLYRASTVIKPTSTTWSDVQDRITIVDSQGRASQTIHNALHTRDASFPVVDHLWGTKNEYTSSGDVQKIVDAYNGAKVYWRANSRFKDGQIECMNVGSAVVRKTYDGLGRPAGIKAGPQGGVDKCNDSGTSLQNASYTFDPVGNLKTRVDASNGLAAQSFLYDSINRLKSGGGMIVTYDGAGNIDTLNGENFGYVANTNRVQTAGARTYGYDSTGNVKTSAGRTVTWKAFNMPASIISGSQTLDYNYGDGFSRVKEVSSATGTTLYFPGGERLISAGGAAMRHRNYIETPEGAIGTVDHVQGTNTFEERYWLKDHLGSIVATISSAADAKVQLGYSVWGERTAAQTPSISTTQRGYTGHEMLDEVGLVHMNGRIYDPAIGKFLSPDPVVQAPLFGQSYNRYAYVMNNPLSATDPTGYSSRWVQWRRPVGAIAAAVLTYGAASWLMGAPVLASGSSTTFATLGLESGFTYAVLTPTGQAIAAAASGFAAGGVGGGNFESAIRGAFFGILNFGIGEAWAAGSWQNIAAHAVVGCAQHSSAGGSCRGGALSGGFSATANAYWSSSTPAAGLAKSVVVGAIASKLSGDSAQNGAVTAAFDYLFNFLSHVHAKVTYEAARKAGLGIADATSLAAAVAAADVGTQGVEDSHMHAMCAAGSSMPVCDLKASDFREKMWESRSSEGLARLLHQSQDQLAVGHAGLQTYDGKSPSWAHIKGDSERYVSPATWTLMRDRSTDLIRNYLRTCPGCVRQP